MTWKNLPTDYTDAAWVGAKKYSLTNNDDGTVSITDETVYTQKEKSFFGAKDANQINGAMNTLASWFDNLDQYETALKDNTKEKTTLISSAKFVVSDASENNVTKKISWETLKTALDYEPKLSGQTATKATPVNADKFVISDSADGNATKKVALSAIKEACKVGLSDAINSTSSSTTYVAATPYAVKQAYDKANTANTTANTAKSTADTAKTNAATAQTTANTAKSTAEAALPKAGGTLTGVLKLTNGTHYGTSLPSAGQAGRIFFKKV